MGRGGQEGAFSDRDICGWAGAVLALRQRPPEEEQREGRQDHEFHVGQVELTSAAPDHRGFPAPSKFTEFGETEKWQ